MENNLSYDKAVREIRGSMVAPADLLFVAIDEWVRWKWLKVILLWLAKWTTRQRGSIYFMTVYLKVVGVYILTWPSILYSLINLAGNPDGKFTKFLLTVVDIYAGGIDMVVFWTITAMALLFMVMHYAVACQNRTSKGNMEKLETGMQKLLTNREFSASLDIRDSDDDYCPVPELHSSRSKLVAEIRRELIDRRVVLIYGGIKEGKSVLSCLVAKSLTGYKVIRVPFNNENKLNIAALLQNYSRRKKLVFVFDAVKYGDTNYYDAFYGIVCEALKGSEWLFIINSYDNFPELSFNGCDIYSFHASPLTKDEVLEMIPVDCRNAFGTFIFGLVGGQPLLAQLACVMMEGKGWSLSEEELGELLTFPRNMSLERKVRRIMGGIVRDDDSYRLLNRLILFDDFFTVEDCVGLAGIAPAVSSPLRCLDRLLNTCVVERDGRYRVSDLLRKTLIVDMSSVEKVSCCEYIVDSIVKNKSLDFHDVLRVLNLLSQAKLYDRAASIYVFAISSLNENNLLDNKHFSILSAIWAGVPLPAEMSLDVQLSVRIVQLTILGPERIKDIKYIENDIDRIIASYSVKSELRDELLKMLVAYYSISNNVQKTAEYQRLSLEVSSEDGPEILNAKDILYVSVNAVRNEQDLYSWFNLYDDSGRPELELLSEAAITVIERISDECNDDTRIESLGRITEVASERNMQDFASASCARMIDLYKIREDYVGAASVFDKYRMLVSTEFGSIIMNYSYGLCLNNEGRVGDSKSYLMKACENQNLSIACMVSFNAAAMLAKILGDEGDVVGAARYIEAIAYNKDFDKSYSEGEKVKVYGSLSYALWQKGEKVAAVETLLKIEDYLWRHHDEIDDEYKRLSTCFAILVMYLHCQANGTEVRKEFARPTYNYFTLDMPQLLELYDPLRNFAVLYSVYQLAELVLNDDEAAIKIIEHFLRMQKSDGQGYGHYLAVMQEAYPLLLAHGRKDLVEHIVLCALADSSATEKDREINYENLVLLEALRHIIVYRVCCMGDGVDFDDEWMLGMIEKSAAYLHDHQRTDRVVDALLSDDPKYSELADMADCATVMTYHIRRMNAEDSLILLSFMVNMMNHAGIKPYNEKYLEKFARSYSKVVISCNPDKFSMAPEESEEYFGKIRGKSGVEYAYEVMVGLYFKMKFTPKLDNKLREYL